MSPQTTGLATFDGKPFALVATDPRVVESAAKLNVTPAFLVNNIQNTLESMTSQHLYVVMEVGTFGMHPETFYEVMYVFLGREPNMHDLTSIPDKRHRHVSTSSATRLLDYFEGVLELLREAREAKISITHLQAAWLVQKFGDRAEDMLDQLYVDCGRSTERMREKLLKKMRKTHHFARFV